jgi:hypothetical protein
MNNPIGPLLAVNGVLNHQISDTFAVFGASAPAWTAKICTTEMTRDAGLQIGFGPGCD